MRRLSFLLFICVYCPDSLSQQLFSQKLNLAAISLTNDIVVYDATYFRIPYPNGDVPKGKGVCTDVIIRAYRRVGIDLQHKVHEDMKHNFHHYPKNWGLSKPDKNIDHRRVPNLMTFFSRHGKTIKISQNPEDFQPGDIVTWDLSPGIAHIGIVIDKKAQGGKRNLIVHNIGKGQEISDCLFENKITGHYRYPANE